MVADLRIVAILGARFDDGWIVDRGDVDGGSVLEPNEHFTIVNGNGFWNEWAARWVREAGERIGLTLTDDVAAARFASLREWEGIGSRAPTFGLWCAVAPDLERDEWLTAMQMRYPTWECAQEAARELRERGL
jgi:hypothetical protein